MPFEIVSTNASPFVVQMGAEIVSTHATQHKAVEAAIIAAESCQCEIVVSRDLQLRVAYTPSQTETECQNEARVIEIQWQAPQARVDGSPIAPGEVAGYRIRTTTINGEHVQEVGNFTTVRGNLYPGSYQFEVAAQDSAGLWSDYSNKYQLSF